MLSYPYQNKEVKIMGFFKNLFKKKEKLSLADSIKADMEVKTSSGEQLNVFDLFALDFTDGAVKEKCKGAFDKVFGNEIFADVPEDVNEWTADFKCLTVNAFVNDEIMASIGLSGVNDLSVDLWVGDMAELSEPTASFAFDKEFDGDIYEESAKKVKEYLDSNSIRY